MFGAVLILGRGNRFFTIQAKKRQGLVPIVGPFFSVRYGNNRVMIVVTVNVPLKSKSNKSGGFNDKFSRFDLIFNRGNTIT